MQEGANQEKKAEENEKKQRKKGRKGKGEMERGRRMNGDNRARPEAEQCTFASVFTFMPNGTFSFTFESYSFKHKDPFN